MQLLDLVYFWEKIELISLQVALLRKKVALLFPSTVV